MKHIRFFFGAFCSPKLKCKTIALLSYLVFRSTTYANNYVLFN